MTRTGRPQPWGWCAMLAWLRGTAPPPLPQHTHAHRFVHLTDGPLTGADRDAALADPTLTDAGCAQLLGVAVAEAQRLRAALPPAGGLGQVGETLPLGETLLPGGGAIPAGEGGPDRTWSHP